MKTDRWRVLPPLFLAAVGFVLAGLLQPKLDRLSEEAGLAPPGNVSAQANPWSAVLTVAPGGLRAPVIGYLWIQAEELKNEGRYYDALQKAQMICALQPHFSGAWVFQAWNMAYNISVGTHTPEHRWLWVHNGLKLLRDQGIPRNPQSLNLYRELSWIFFHKMGGTTDDMHFVYKQRWAALMQHLLAPPPYGSTEETIDAFRPIVAARLDKDRRIQGKELIQADELQLLLEENPAAARCADELAKLGIGVDESMLDAYNRFSMDVNIQTVRPVPPELTTKQEQAIAKIINDPNLAVGRNALLAFIRAQLLWNQYRMDPDWMLGLMEQYGPMDWRLIWPHAIYWATYGFHVVENTPLESLRRIEALNNSRNILNALKDLTWNGRLTYFENRNDPQSPSIRFNPDPRFLQTTQDEHHRLMELASTQRLESEQHNMFRAGHINYIINAIQMLYPLNRHDEARELMRYTRDQYAPEGEEWTWDLQEFVVHHLNADGSPIRAVAMSQIAPAIETGWLLRLLGRNDQARAMMQYGQRVYNIYQNETTERNRLQPLEYFHADVVSGLLVLPRVREFNMSLIDRARLWRLIPEDLRLIIYDTVAPMLVRQCRAENAPFEELFPAPPGLDEFRRARSQPRENIQQ